MRTLDHASPIPPRSLALDETGLPDGAFPASCPYSAEQVQDQAFLPE